MRYRNHFLAQAYLKQWAVDQGRVWTYPTLVSSESYPQWKRRSPKGVAYLEHLYSRMDLGSETDVMEGWLAENVDEPAHGERGDEAKAPQEQQDDCDGFNHWVSFG